MLQLLLTYTFNVFMSFKVTKPMRGFTLTFNNIIEFYLPKTSYEKKNLLEL